MSEAIERADLILGEVARLSLELARDLQQRALKAEADDAAARLASAFNQTCRSIRQSLALQERLQRERRRGDADVQDAARREAVARRDHRKSQVRSAVQRLAWTEKPDWNLFSTRTRLDLILDAEAEAEAFADLPVAGHVASIARALGLSSAPVPATRASSQARNPTADAPAAAATNPPPPPATAHALNTS